MRLQLALLLAIVTAARTSQGWAQERETGEGRAQSRVLVYSDDDATSVVTTAADAEIVAPGRVSIGAHALVDSISSASVDVVTAATGRWDEDRVEAGVRLGREFSRVMTQVGVTRSQENDWLSHTASLRASRDFFQRNTTASATYFFTQNEIGRAEDPNFQRSLGGHTIELGLTQLVDTRTRVGAGYSLQRLDGYLASPYRFVVAEDQSSSPERHPGSRMRHAASGYIVRALGDLAAGRAEYRIYRDDWGLLSHTLGLRLSAEPVTGLIAGVEGRAYRQSKADFYQDSYPARVRYMSFDRELSPFWDAGAGASLAYSWGPVAFDVKASWIHYRFKEFSRLPRRNVQLLGAGVGVVW